MSLCKEKLHERTIPSRSGRRAKSLNSRCGRWRPQLPSSSRLQMHCLWTDSRAILTCCAGIGSIGALIRLPSRCLRAACGHGWAAFPIPARARHRWAAAGPRPASSGGAVFPGWIRRDAIARARESGEVSLGAVFRHGAERVGEPSCRTLVIGCKGHPHVAVLGP